MQTEQVCQLSRLAYIPTCRSTQRWLTRCSVVTRHRPLCHTWLATVQCIIALCFRALGANPWAKIHQNRSWPATHPGLPSCQFSSPCVNPRWRYPLQKICGQTKKERNEQQMIYPQHAYQHMGIILESRWSWYHGWSIDSCWWERSTVCYLPGVVGAVFQLNARYFPTIKWQFFVTVDGIHSEYPAHSFTATACPSVYATRHR